MKKRSILAIASAALGLTVLGAGAASAATGTSPVEWAQQLGQQNGYSYSYGDGDPATCPNYDGTADQTQDRTRDRLMDPSLATDHDATQQQLRDRVDVTN